MAVRADARIPIWPLTVDGYERLVDAGILGGSDRVELLNGQLAEMSPQGSPHAAVIQWLATTLIRALDPSVAAVRVQSPLRLAPLSQPEPDIAVAAPGSYAEHHPATALLVIEVAVSSTLLDLGTKAEIYAAAGIDEYWIVDVPARAVHVLESPLEDGYQSRHRATTGALRPTFAGAPRIDLGTLFSLLD